MSGYSTSLGEGLYRITIGHSGGYAGFHEIYGSYWLSSTGSKGELLPLMTANSAIYAISYSNGNFAVSFSGEGWYTVLIEPMS